MSCIVMNIHFFDPLLLNYNGTVKTDIKLSLTELKTKSLTPSDFGKPPNTY